MKVAWALVVLKGVACTSAAWKLVSFSFDCRPFTYSMIYRQQFWVRKIRRTGVPHVWLLDPLNGQHNNHTNSCQIYKNTTINHRLEICKCNCTNPHCAVWKMTSSVWQVRSTSAPLFWLLAFYKLNGPNDDCTNSYQICKNATSKLNTKAVILGLYKSSRSMMFSHCAVWKTTSSVWQVRRTGAPLFWLLAFYKLNGPNDDYTNSYQICKNATSKLNTKAVILGLYKSSRSMMFSHCAVWKTTSSVWQVRRTGAPLFWLLAFYTLNGPNEQWWLDSISLLLLFISMDFLQFFLLTHHYEFKGFLKLNSSTHNNFNISKLLFGTVGRNLPNILSFLISQNSFTKF